MTDLVSLFSQYFIVGRKASVVLASITDKLESINITDDGYYYFCGAVVLFYTVVVLCGRAIFGNNAKKLSWCLSLANSLIMSIIGCVFTVVYFPRYGSQLINGTPNGDSLMHGIDNLGLLTCTAFAIANVLDLVYGLIFYRSELTFLTSYFHHTMYIWLMHFAITSNGLFTTTRGPFTTAFLFCAIEEIPTFILGLGSIVPSLRSDLGFGVSFLIFRVIYHIFLIMHEYKYQTFIPMFILLLITFAMHVNWWYGWITKYAFGKTKKAGKKSV